MFKSKVRGSIQEMILPDFPDDDATINTTTTKSRRVSFGTNLVKEFIVGSAVSTQCVSEYEQAFSSSDSSNTNSSHSFVNSRNLEKSTFTVENFRNSVGQNTFTIENQKQQLKQSTFTIENQEDIMQNTFTLEKQKEHHSIVGKTSCEFDPNENYPKRPKFSRTICFNVDSPTADMEFTEGCLTLAKNILDKKNKDMRVIIQAESKEEKVDKNDSTKYFSSFGDMNLTQCVTSKENKKNDKTFQVEKSKTFNVLNDDTENCTLFGKKLSSSISESCFNDSLKENQMPLDLIIQKLDKNNSDSDSLYPEKTLNAALNASLFDSDENDDKLSLNESMDITLDLSPKRVTCVEGEGKIQHLSIEDEFDKQLLIKNQLPVLELKNLNDKEDSFLEKVGHDINTELSKNLAEEMEISLGNSLEETNVQKKKNVLELENQVSDIRLEREDPNLKKQVPQLIEDTPNKCEFYEEINYMKKVNEKTDVRENVSNSSNICFDLKEFGNKLGIESFINETEEFKNDLNLNGSNSYLNIFRKNENENEMLNESDYEEKKKEQNLIEMSRTIEESTNKPKFHKEIKFIKKVNEKNDLKENVSNSDNISFDLKESENNEVPIKSSINEIETSKHILNLNESNLYLNVSKKDKNEMLTECDNEKEEEEQSLVKVSEIIEESSNKLKFHKEIEFIKKVNEKNDLEENVSNSVNISVDLKESENNELIIKSSINETESSKNLSNLNVSKKDENEMLADCDNEKEEEEQSLVKVSEIIEESSNKPEFHEEIEFIKKVNEKNDLEENVSNSVNISVDLKESENNELIIKSSINETESSKNLSNLNVSKKDENEMLADCDNEKKEEELTHEIDCSKNLSNVSKMDEDEILIECDKEEKEKELTHQEKGDAFKASIVNLNTAEDEATGNIAEIDLELLVDDRIIETQSNSNLEEVDGGLLLQATSLKNQKSEKFEEIAESPLFENKMIQDQNVEKSEEIVMESKLVDYEAVKHQLMEESDEITLEPPLVDSRVIEDLKTQSEESNCLWTLQSWKYDAKNTYGIWNFSLKLLESYSTLIFELNLMERNNMVSHGVVKSVSIYLNKENECRLKEYYPTLEFGYLHQKEYLEEKKKMVKTVLQIPYFLDLFNSYMVKLNSYLSQIYSILTLYPGSTLQNSILTFRLFSFPIFFSCNVSINLTDLYQLSEDSISFEYDFGNLDEIKIKDIFGECLKSKNSLTEFIIKSTKYLIDIEQKIGKVSKRSYLRLLPSEMRY